MDDDDNMSMNSHSFVKMIEDDKDAAKIFHIKGRQISATVEEVDEDKNEDESELDNGSYNMSGSGHAIINFEIMFDQVKIFEADFVDANDYVLNYKNNVSYMNTSKAEV